MPIYGPPTEEEREKLNHPPRSPEGQHQLMEIRLKEEYGVDPGAYSDDEMKFLFEQMREDVKHLQQRRQNLTLQIEALKEYLDELQPLYEDAVQRAAQEELEELTDDSAYPTQESDSEE